MNNSVFSAVRLVIHFSLRVSLRTWEVWRKSKAANHFHAPSPAGCTVLEDKSTGHSGAAKLCDVSVGWMLSTLPWCQMVAPFLFFSLAEEKLLLLSFNLSPVCKMGKFKLHALDKEEMREEGKGKISSWSQRDAWSSQKGFDPSLSSRALNAGVNTLSFEKLW